MEQCIFSFQSVITMFNDCHWAGKNLETGGVLVGLKKFKRVVTGVIPSTTYAEKGAVTYFQTSQDVEILNLKLREYQKRGYDFKGYFHQHPSGLSRLSSGDLATCKGILQDPSYKINNDLLMVIVTETPDVNRSPIFAYGVSLSNKEKVLVRELSYKIMPDRCIEEYLIDCFEQEKEEDNESNDNRHNAERAGSPEECGKQR